MLESPTVTDADADDWFTTFRRACRALDPGLLLRLSPRDWRTVALARTADASPYALAAELAAPCAP